MNLVLALQFISTSCHSDEILQIETLPRIRTQHYSIAPYRKVVIFSAPRTGSSLVYNVFRFLFEEEEQLSHAHDEFRPDCSVLKTHKSSDLDLLAERNVLYVVPIRNPIHAAVSTYRIRVNSVKDNEDFSAKNIGKQGRALRFADSMKEAGRSVVFIKYEDFSENLDALFARIEQCFQISIAPADKQTMLAAYKKENIYAAISALPNFQEYLPISGFHGKHVTIEKYTPSDNLLYWLDYHLQEVKPLFQRYGYFLD